MTTSLLICRHPETEANVTARFVGRGDSPYTACGAEQVERIAEAIVAFAPSVVYSSSLQRAFLPADAAARARGVDHVVDDRLIELDFGDAEGLTWDEIQRAGMTFDYKSYAEPIAPNGESRAQIEARASAFAAEMRDAGGRIAVVTHGGPMRALVVSLLGLAHTDVWAFHLKNAQLAYITVAEDGRGWLEEFRQA